MIGYVMLGTNDLDRAARFHDATLATLGLVQVERTGTYAAYAPETVPRPTRGGQRHMPCLSARSGRRQALRVPRPGHGVTP